MYSLIASAKLNGVDPRAWLTNELARIGDHPASRLHELLLWNGRRRLTDWPLERGTAMAAADSVNEICTLRIELCDSFPDCEAPPYRQP